MKYVCVKAQNCLAEIKCKVMNFVVNGQEFRAKWCELKNNPNALAFGLFCQQYQSRCLWFEEFINTFADVVDILVAQFIIERQAKQGVGEAVAVGKLATPMAILVELALVQREVV